MDMIDVRKRGISDEHELIENYNPEASPNVVTKCPGCDGVIVVFQSGEIAQPRTTEIPIGELPDLVDAAFEKHFCPAKPGRYACVNCESRYDNEEDAKNCCLGPFVDKRYIIEVEGADPIEEQEI